MNHLYDLLTEWGDHQTIRPTQAQLARLIGVTRGTVTNWKDGKSPRPEQVDKIVTATGLSRTDVLTAMLRDQGYLRVESLELDDAASNTRVRGSRTQDNVRDFPSPQPIPEAPDEAAARDEPEPSQYEQVVTDQDQDAEQGDE